ncbi:MAG: hypothetical protein MZV70_29120 [Desulfobacterales bacterium]|nr:hypothetical protein [Desulfobacterales bacterium]
MLDADYDQEAEFEQKKHELSQQEVIGMIREPSQNLSNKAIDLANSGGSNLPAPSTPEGTNGRPTN